MGFKFVLSFDDFDDFDQFMEKHESTINMMGEGQNPLATNIRQQVQMNEQLPEFFKFTDDQMRWMKANNKIGIKRLMTDSRVTIKR